MLVNWDAIRETLEFYQSTIEIVMTFEHILLVGTIVALSFGWYLIIKGDH